LKLGQVAIPPEIAEELTYPERVTVFNKDKLTDIINNDKANFVLKPDGMRINLKYAMYRKGTDLLYGDIVVKGEDITLREDDDGNVIIPNEKLGNKFIKVINDNVKLEEGDRLIRNGQLMENVSYLTKKRYNLEIGDVVERHLKDGDTVLINRIKCLLSETGGVKSVLPPSPF
jgi:DNA-directed RNA polymerase beta' subunit